MMECPRCKREHKTLTGRTVPFCAAHVSRDGECDLRGSHICGETYIALALQDAGIWQRSR